MSSKLPLDLGPSFFGHSFIGLLGVVLVGLVSVVGVGGSRVFSCGDACVVLPRGESGVLEGLLPPLVFTLHGFCATLFRRDFFPWFRIWCFYILFVYGMVSLFFNHGGDLPTIYLLILSWLMSVSWCFFCLST